MVNISEKNLQPLWALEIKWSNRFFEKPGELRSLLRFCKQNNLKTAIVTTIDQEGSKKVGNIELHFFPAAAYTCTVGRNTFNVRRR